MKKTLITLSLISSLYSAEMRNTFPDSACFYVGEAFLSADSCSIRNAEAIQRANLYGADFVIDEQCSNSTRSGSYNKDGHYAHVDWWRYALAANRPKDLNKVYDYSYPLHFPFAGSETLYSFYIQYPYHLGIITQNLKIVGFDLAQKSNGLAVGDEIVKLNDIPVSNPQAMSQLLQINESTPVKVTVMRQNQFVEAWIKPLKVNSKPAAAKPQPKPTSDNIIYYPTPPKRASLYLGKVRGSIFGNKINASSYEDARLLGADYITIIPFTDTFYQNNGKGRFIFRNELKEKYASQDALSRSASNYFPPLKRPEFANYCAFAYLPSSLGIITDNNYRVIGFDPDSKAHGIQLNDEIVGINNIDRSQNEYLWQLMNVYPGDSVIINVIRNGNRLDIQVIAIEP